MKEIILTTDHCPLTTIKMEESRNNRLIEELKKSGLISSPGVEAAFRAMPRHLFLPDVPLDEVYADRAIVTKTQDGLPISSSSQPAIMAIMLEQLGPQPGECVLEIGAGTGYNAALMGHMVGPTGHVTSIDIDEDLVDKANANLSRAGVENVDVIYTDGGFGYPSSAPYDAVIATVGVWDIPPAWLEQLREGGRQVLPLSLSALQFSILFNERHGQLVSRDIRSCGFMPLRGSFAGPKGDIQIDNLVIRVEDASRVDAEALATLLTAPCHDQQLAELPSAGFRNATLYFALASPSLLVIMDYKKEQFDHEFSFALLEGSNSLAVLLPPSEQNGQGASVRIYGNDSALSKLKKLVAEWQGQGQPNLERARVTAIPLGTTPSPEGGFVIPKKWMQYHIQF